LRRACIYLYAPYVRLLKMCPLGSRDTLCVKGLEERDRQMKDTAYQELLAKTPEDRVCLPAGPQ
jgi:hypothetical protein